MRNNNKLLYLTLLAILGMNSDVLLAQSLRQSPRLVVNITIDQLRTDHLETYAPLYSADGFKKLLNEGFVFSNGSYNYVPIDRASSIATLSTGTVPYYHGIVAQEWLDKSTLKRQHCVRDPQYGQSPIHLGTSTLGDEIKVSTQGGAKVFSFAPFCDAAILSAGHAADGVAWTENGHWSLSTYYRPVSTWLSSAARLFPAVEDTNSAITDLALQCVEQTGMGLDDKPDLLNVVYEDRRHNVQGKSEDDLLLEGYLSLDRNVGRLIKGIEQRLGRERVLFVVTGSGYCDETEDTENERYRIPAGTMNLTRSANLLNMYLGAIYGTDRYVETCYKNQVFLNRELMDRRNINVGEALKRSQEFLLQMAGVRNVYTSDQLLTSDNYVLYKTRNGFCKEKCGDLMVDVAPGWKLVNEDTGSTLSPRAGYVPFPIIFYGADVAHEQVTTPVTTDRIAPTIAKSIRIRAPNACAAEPLF